MEEEAAYQDHGRQVPLFFFVTAWEKGEEDKTAAENGLQRIQEQGQSAVSPVGEEGSDPGGPDGAGDLLGGVAQHAPVEPDTFVKRVGPLGGGFLGEEGESGAGSESGEGFPEVYHGLLLLDIGIHARRQVALHIVVVPPAGTLVTAVSQAHDHPGEGGAAGVKVIAGLPLQNQDRDAGREKNHQDQTCR